MPQAIIYFDDIEDAIIRERAAKDNITKHDAVKLIIRESKNKAGGKRD